MVDNQGIALTSNWSTLRDADLSSVLIKDTSNDVEIHIEDITADNCVCLVRNDFAKNSKAYLEIKVNGTINSISLLSEAQVIEVFGVNDEYLSTHTSEFYDDWEGMSVYYSQIYVHDISVAKLKFTRTRSNVRVWIYGLKISIQKKTNPGIQHRFNLVEINRLLGNSNFVNLSRGIEFKNLLNSNLHYLLRKKLMPDDTHTVSSSTEPNERNHESVTVVNPSDSAESQKVCSKESESCSNTWLKTYIDRKFSEIKTDILQEVDLRINSFREETNQKLDKIISLLDKRDMQNK